ncbi:Dedicator of cytokinesis protein 1, partial [Ilyodon furcidens]
GAALKYIPTIVNDVKLVFDPKELSKLFTEFILKVPQGRLVKQKLDCLIDIVHSDLFTHHGESAAARNRSYKLYCQSLSAGSLTHSSII